MIVSSYDNGFCNLAGKVTHFFSIPTNFSSTFCIFVSQQPRQSSCFRVLKSSDQLSWEHASIEAIKNMILDKSNALWFLTQCFWATNSMLLGSKLNALGF
jgi:hypothetical protein